MSLPEPNIISLISQVDPRSENPTPLQVAQPLIDRPSRAPAVVPLAVGTKVTAQISSVLALIRAIDYGELLAVPPEDEAERHRHRTALSMIDLMEQELCGALESLKSVAETH